MKVTEARWWVKETHYTLLFISVHSWNFESSWSVYEKFFPLLMWLKEIYRRIMYCPNIYLHEYTIMLHTTTSCRLFGRLTVEMPWNGRWEKSIFCKGPPTLWLRVKDTFRFDKLLGTGENFIVWTSPVAVFISSLKNKEEMPCLCYTTI